MEEKIFNSFNDSLNIERERSELIRAVDRMGALEQTVSDLLQDNEKYNSVLIGSVDGLGNPKEGLVLAVARMVDVMQEFKEDLLGNGKPGVVTRLTHLEKERKMILWVLGVVSSGVILGVINEFFSFF